MLRRAPLEGELRTADLLPPTGGEFHPLGYVRGVGCPPEEVASRAHIMSVGSC